ncbi:MAG: DUF1460 domain-containing protein [Thermodesulfovibrionales bacterium]|nr:DUF1460 domain-containing protein [Thermodesulfovibrionales bacterium]
MRDEAISLGITSIDKINNLLKKTSALKSQGKRIALLSAFLLGVPYRENTLIGNMKTSEIFVINLEAVDCLTFLEYVEAMRLASSFAEFIERLRQIRYQQGEVSYFKRNHFFTDWLYNNSNFVKDVTTKIGRDKAIKVYKRLNLKRDGNLFLDGLPILNREINYIPSKRITEEIIKKLKTGDYIGVYANQEGLDVTHVGIIIKEAKRVLLRHASSKETIRKVVDEEFVLYIANKPGIVVMRAK